MYASPEQISADMELFDWRTDIYSLGIIMLQLLNPFATTMELLQSIKLCK
jgi:serine/threonine protein kinase